MARKSFKNRVLFTNLFLRTHFILVLKKPNVFSHWNGVKHYLIMTVDHPNSRNTAYFGL